MHNYRYIIDVSEYIKPSVLNLLIKRFGGKSLLYDILCTSALKIATIPSDKNIPYKVQHLNVMSELYISLMVPEYPESEWVIERYLNSLVHCISDAMKAIIDTYGESNKGVTNDFFNRHQIHFTHKNVFNRTFFIFETTCQNNAQR